MADEPKHIVSSFEADLKKLRDMIANMGGLVERAVADASSALVNHDPELASRVIENDSRINTEQHNVEQFAVRLLALRQPVADDLRQVIQALKVVNDLERVGDYAANIAKRSIVINQVASNFPLAGLGQMARLVQQNLQASIDTVGESDPQKAIAVWRADQMVDDLYNTIFRELITYMMEDARNITACTHLMFIAKNLERIGDHTTNIAELTYYAITGENLPDFRPKGDVTSTYVHTTTN
ncbi:phosphate signaling complex protein PhoU [Acidocella aminolytica]|jgi:phosphate transport system protein|uniref:Phosphate-specific transport system accessory protein PhoU n=1 Tax=Acidocella aminolytica 101 = DSM 11237 TaxID=1120923 RepID=A0A0D6PGI5_9PROT|nr:phosphate signaling complex protein PhoU [Acidocella aminolytica]GAN80308.1 transcriptional regulator for phosphate uptake PhoU [Acidocella aminolytica 101 = DSM 11237]GBQ33354.1 transcriptional regulator for phosphate uptake PhoU [Acidocella aminolytica 101 = DSM 11237]SHF49391.1 phosphate uptake regulator, PhoU [Acidocella aminolytica 101 = DSM 11237]